MLYQGQKDEHDSCNRFREIFQGPKDLRLTEPIAQCQKQEGKEEGQRGGGKRRQPCDAGADSNSDIVQG